jgi:hypothetical protein
MSELIVALKHKKDWFYPEEHKVAVILHALHDLYGEKCLKILFRHIYRCV